MLRGLIHPLRSNNLLSFEKRACDLFFRNGLATAVNVKKTSLYNLHKEKGGQMVEFAGWSLPIKYDDLTHTQSHLHTRKDASIFDVSHMLQTKWTGKDRVEFIERLVVGDIQNLKEGEATLSLFTNSNGGIIDDTVICKHKDHLYVVSNAGCAEKDWQHIQHQLSLFKNEGKDVDVQIIDTHSLLALQGPKAAEALQKLVDFDLKEMNFMNGQFLKVNNIPCHVARVGYTGEDGFEISVPNEFAIDLTNKLLENSSVKLAGLAARDSLRLEGGLCLYGHDLNEEITPIEATLRWTIGKRRKEEGGFLGAEKILNQIKTGVDKKRVGFTITGAPAREGAKLYNLEEKEIGIITSGSPSPSLKKNIAMGYIHSEYAKSGTELKVMVRNKFYKAIVTKMPFVPAGYYRKE